MRKYNVFYLLLEPGQEEQKLLLQFEMHEAKWPEIEMITAAYWAEKKIREKHSPDPTQCVPFSILKLEVDGTKNYLRLFRRVQ